MHILVLLSLSLLYFSFLSLCCARRRERYSLSWSDSSKEGTVRVILWEWSHASGAHHATFSLEHRGDTDLENPICGETSREDLPNGTLVNIIGARIAQRMYLGSQQRSNSVTNRVLLRTTLELFRRKFSVVVCIILLLDYVARMLIIETPKAVRSTKRRTEEEAVMIRFIYFWAGSASSRCLGQGNTLLKVNLFCFHPSSSVIS